MTLHHILQFSGKYLYRTCLFLCGGVRRLSIFWMINLEKIVLYLGTCGNSKRLLVSVVPDLETSLTRSPMHTCSVTRVCAHLTHLPTHSSTHSHAFTVSHTPLLAWSGSQLLMYAHTHMHGNTNTQSCISLTQLTCLLTHTVTHALTLSHPPTHSLIPPITLTPSPITLTPSPTTLIHPPTHPPTHALTHSLTHSLTHARTHTHSPPSVTHSLNVYTCSLTQMCMCASYAASTVWSKHWCVKVTDKIVPVHTLTAYLGFELIVPLTHNLGTRWRWALNFMPRWFDLEEKHLWYSLNMGCVDHQVGWDKWEKVFLLCWEMNCDMSFVLIF